MLSDVKAEMGRESVGYVLTQAVLSSVTNAFCEVLGRPRSKVEGTTGIFEMTMGNLN